MLVGFEVPGEAVEGFGAFVKVDGLVFGNDLLGSGAVGFGGVKGEEHLLGFTRTTFERAAAGIDGE